MRTSLLLTSLALALLLSACGPQKPLTPEQQAAQLDKEECAANASSMTDAPHSSDNPFWDSYFTMCMSQRGYTWDQLKKMWY